MFSQKLNKMKDFLHMNYMMKLLCLILPLILIFCCSTRLDAQNVYELRKLTDDTWRSMSTEERFNALSATNKHAENQTFLGNFGRNQDLYKRWGYDYYEMNDSYENYSFRDFIGYDVVENRRLRWSYNEFGDRIVKMTPLNNLWSEKYFGDGTHTVNGPNYYINAMTTGQVDGVWVVREATNDWAVSVVAAGALRTKFTPLTLSLPNMNGVSFNLQSANNSLMLINSSLLGNWYYWGATNNAKYVYEKGGILLKGGHFQRKIGILTLGATYVNQYGVQGNRDGGDKLFGTVTNMTPTPLILAVRFLDDSPSDNSGGPVINEVRLKLNGRYRDDIIPQIVLDDVTRDRATAISNRLLAGYLDPGTSLDNPQKYDFLKIEATLPKYGDYAYLNDFIKGTNIVKADKDVNNDLMYSYYTLLEQVNQPLTANGTDAIVYLFDISSIVDTIRDAEVEITVANDYLIQTAMIFTKESTGGHDTSGNNTNWYNATYWRNAAQSEGNIKDGSNVKKLTLNFGYQVASVMYGCDAHLKFRGLEVRAEYVRNSSHYMFADGAPGTGRQSQIISNQPVRTGKRWTQNDDSYYVTAEKDWKHVGFAGEIFKMGKFYRPYIDYYYPVEAGFKFGDGAINSRNFTVRHPLIEDNDDNDMYPDTQVVQRNMQNNLFSADDPDGTFPGNDNDHDGIPDNNKNNNNIPDYDEPFLMFDVDPDEFVFGNDYNNNSIPDFREDDMKLDTPYDLDRQGYHFIFKLSPIKEVNVFAGSMNTRGVGKSNRTSTDYLKFQLDYYMFNVGKLYAEYRYELIQDDIPDTYLQVQTGQRADYLIPGMTATFGRYERELFYDELEYRNSKVSRLYVSSLIKVIPSFTVENHVKLENNNQIKGTMYEGTYQPHDIIHTFAMINKLSYTKELGKFVISPGIKFRTYKKDRSESGQPLDYYFLTMPLVMLKYNISSDTNIMFGMQGIPGLDQKYKDFKQSENDHKKKIHTLIFR